MTVVVKSTASTTKSAVVIGGGFIGISSAIHLASRGFAVTVLEKSKTGVAEKDGDAASYGNAGTFAPYATFGLNEDRVGIFRSAFEAFFGGGSSMMLFGEILQRSARVYVLSLFDQ